MSVKLMAATFAAHFPDIEYEHIRKKKTGETVTVTVKVLASTAKWVAVALADHANDEGEGAYPSVDLLADKTDLSAVSVIAALKGLKHAGIITYVGLSKRKTSNYTVNREKLVQMANQPRQVREKPQVKAALPIEEKDESKAALPPEVKPLYPEGKAALPESSLTTQNHPFSADAQKTAKSEKPAPPPPEWGIGWQLGAGVDQVQLPSQEEENQAKLLNALNLFHEHEQPFVKTFYLETGILPVKTDVAFWRKAITYLMEKLVEPEHLADAARQAAKDGMTVSSPKSLEKYAVDIRAKARRKPAQPAPHETDFARHLANFKPRTR